MKSIVRAAAMALAISLPVYATGTGAAIAQDVKEIRIANSIDVLDQAQNAILDSMKKRVDEINAEGKYKVTMDVYDAQSNVDKQLSDVQTALIKKPDVLIFSAVDVVGSLPAVQAAKDAGVKVIDRRPTDPEPEIFDVAFHAHDEAGYVKATTDWIRKHLDDNPDKVLKVGVIYGAPAQTPQLLRINAIKALAAEIPDRMQIVDEAYGNWLTATAQSITEDWMIAHPEINYIASANDQMALGISNALISTGRTDVMVSGYDHEEAAVARVKEGTQTLTVGARHADNSQNIDVAIALVEGTFKDKDYYLRPVYATDASNVDEWLANQKK